MFKPIVAFRNVCSGQEATHADSYSFVGEVHVKQPVESQRSQFAEQASQVLFLLYCAKGHWVTQVLFDRMKGSEHTEQAELKVQVSQCPGHAEL